MNIIYLPTESCDHFQELFLESDLFWVEEGRGDGIISVNFEYFSHINYRLQTIWIKFCICMGMNPTGSTDSHFVLSSVILFDYITWFECCQNYCTCTSCSKYLIVCCYCLFSHHETALYHPAGTVVCLAVTGASTAKYIVTREWWPPVQEWPNFPI